MRTRLIALFLLIGFVAAAQVSYWFSGFQRQGSAQLAQQYFFRPGTNLVFSYDGTYVYLNSTGGGGGVAAKGLATLVSGSVNIPTALVAANSVIQLTYISLNGRLSNVGVISITPGVAFTVQSASGSDNNEVAWSILSP